MKPYLKINIMAGFIVLLSLVLVNGCNQTSGSNPQSKESVMLPVTETAVGHQPRPPIDLLAPDHYETATFALG